jgi:hypothetical protein
MNTGFSPCYEFEPISFVIYEFRNGLVSMGNQFQQCSLAARDASERTVTIAAHIIDETVADKICQ